MLLGTLVLILFGWVMFAALEWNNPAMLGQLGASGVRIWANWFQAVTPRTAEFNTRDYSQVHESTALMTMTMMVGGGGTSTAAGIKVTTLIVLILATIAFLHRSTSLHAFGRSMGSEEVFKVMALTSISTSAMTANSSTWRSR